MCEQKRPQYYLLLGRRAVPTDFVDWCLSHGGDRDIGYDESGITSVDTKFTGDDINDTGPPAIFKTTLWRASKTVEEWYYPTWNQAKQGHSRVVGTVMSTAWYAKAWRWAATWCKVLQWVLDGSPSLAEEEARKTYSRFKT